MVSEIGPGICDRYFPFGFFGWRYCGSAYCHVHYIAFWVVICVHTYRGVGICWGSLLVLIIPRPGKAPAGKCPCTATHPFDSGERTGTGNELGCFPITQHTKS